MRFQKITIIDEDKESLDYLEGVLSTTGYDPFVISNSHSLVEKAISSKPDVILMELNMKGMNGFELANKINHHVEENKIPIVGMSSFFKDEFGFLLNMCGIRQYIRKPFHPVDLIWAIENAIEQRFALGSASLELQHV